MQQGHTWLQAQSTGQTDSSAVAAVVVATTELVLPMRAEAASVGELRLFMRLDSVSVSIFFFLTLNHKERNLRWKEPLSRSADSGQTGARGATAKADVSGEGSMPDVTIPERRREE